LVSSAYSWTLAIVFDCAVKAGICVLVNIDESKGCIWNLPSSMHLLTAVTHNKWQTLVGYVSLKALFSILIRRTIMDEILERIDQANRASDVMIRRIKICMIIVASITFLAYTALGAPL